MVITHMKAISIVQHKGYKCVDSTNTLPYSPLVRPTHSFELFKSLKLLNDKYYIKMYVVTEDGRTYLFTSADDNNVVDDMMMMMMMMCPRVSS